MANSDKTIIITPSTGTANEPSIGFTGGDNNPITLRVIDDGTLSFEASEGQVFSVSESLSGEIFSVSDISGIPAILVKDTGDLQLNPHAGNVLVGLQDDNLLDKMQIQGGVTIFGETGQLFSVTDDDSEDIFSVNDISGIPSIRVKDNGNILLAEYAGVVSVGNTAPTVQVGMQIMGGLRVVCTNDHPDNVNGDDYVISSSRQNGSDWGIGTTGYQDYGMRIETANTATYAMIVANTSGIVFSINGAGDALAASHGSISDQRLKENVTTLTGSLDLIKNLRGVNFTWIDKPELGTQIGFIAQEIEQHAPSVVISSSEEESVLPGGETVTNYKHVEYGKLVPVLVEAIKEQQTMIEALQARLDTAGL